MKKTVIRPLRRLPGENWWGAAADAGTRMPFAAGEELDLRGENFANQAAPLLLSSAGRYVWSDAPFRVRFGAGSLRLEGRGPFVAGRAGGTLKTAYCAAARRFFPPCGKLPEPLLFTAPQYNTWIELLYDQAQEPVLKYARDIVRNGFDPGVLMIDEGWFRYYGDWRFDPERFPDPRGMIRELHGLGFKVMLWVIPFVVPDSRVFRGLRNRRVLVRTPDGKPAIREWWNGFSAVVDVTGGEGRDWFLAQLHRLQDETGVDGFKFDGGDTPFYRDDDVLAAPCGANGHTEAFGKLGAAFRLNEYRACWKCGGEPLVQRLRDKNHAWDETGLASLIPNTIAQGLLGHPFVCPDMIGGGEYTNFLANSGKLDQELFVRYAQASALMPMMQFSAAPWRVLDRRHLRLCQASAALHRKTGPAILKLARQSARGGEPMVRALAYEFPGCGYEAVKDQFMLGPDLLVAPVLKKKAETRTVVIPPGAWTAEDGERFAGPATVEIAAPLERLPHFRRE